VLLHRRELKLKPGEIVELNVEIWPGATHFEPGEGLRLLIQGSDVMVFHVMNCADCRNIENQLFILGMNRLLIVVIISFIREASIRHPCYFLLFQLIERVYSPKLRIANLSLQCELSILKPMHIPNTCPIPS